MNKFKVNSPFLELSSDKLIKISFFSINCWYICEYLTKIAPQNKCTECSRLIQSIEFFYRCFDHMKSVIKELWRFK